MEPARNLRTTRTSTETSAIFKNALRMDKRSCAVSGHRNIDRSGVAASPITFLNNPNRASALGLNGPVHRLSLAASQARATMLATVHSTRVICNLIRFV
jgi:hypothetical protein